MISFFEAELHSVSVHRVGNKLNDEYFVLSKQPIAFDPEQKAQLLNFFLKPFEKVNDQYNFYHPSGKVNLNPVFTKFSNIADAHYLSQEVVRILWETSNHPKIKSGEFYLAVFQNVQFEGELLPAIGVFKSENKETFLKVKPFNDGFDVSFENEAINIDKLDKGCLVIHHENKPFTVLSFDKNTNDGSYWKDEFLGLKILDNDYKKTSDILAIAKNFITDKLDEEFEISATDKVDLLNKTIQYFKEKESFDVDEFTADVLQNKEATTAFKAYKSIYDEEFDQQTPNSFNISNAAVKKSASSFKKIIKLDKNFHIYVHGNKDLIEQGFDKDKAMNFYKVYFKEEA